MNVEDSAQRNDPRRQSIEAILDAKLRNKLLVRKEIKRLTDYLDVDEELVTAASGMYEDRNGLLAVTERRMLFVDEGLMRKRLEEFQYERISSVQWKSGLVMAEIKIYASGNTARIRQIAPKERAQEIAAYTSRRISEGRSAPTSPIHASVGQVPTEPASAPSSDPIEQIRRLAELRDLGAITTEEFEAKKSDLLKLI